MSKMVKDTVYLEALNVFLNASFFGCQFFHECSKKKNCCAAGQF